MRFSKSSEYAVMATCYVAKHSDGNNVLSQLISKEYGIPLEYLLKILQQLSSANVLRSKRGPNGGFVLARKAEETTMAEVIEAADGPIVVPSRINELENIGQCGTEAMYHYEQASLKARQHFAQVFISDLI